MSLFDPAKMEELPDGQRQVADLLNNAEALAIKMNCQVVLTWTFESGAKIKLEAGTAKKKKQVAR